VSTDKIIKERGIRYGSFNDGARLMRELKLVMHNHRGWDRLSSAQKEALDMIQHKIGRILNGDPDYDDSWRDIAGYSELIVKIINGENP
jgi:hypothetical protein